MATLGQAGNGQNLVVIHTWGQPSPIEAPARTANGIQRGTVIMPFTDHEAAANLLTNEALDPFGKIPEFKYCAVSLVPKATNQRRFATG